jgi:DNA primase
VTAVNFTPEEISAYYIARLPDLRQRGTEWRGPCPVHRGKDDNFSVNPKNGLACCHSQCGRGWNVLQLEEALTGRTWPDSREEIFSIMGRSAQPTALREVATYDYTDAKGEFLFQVVRYEPKRFKQRRRVVKLNGTSIGWEYNVKGTRRVLYRLPKVLAADQVLLVEGEKDAGNLERLGFTTTCNSGGACTGAGKWLKNYTESLEGKCVVIFPDNDEPGKKHADIVTQAIRHRVKELKVVTVPVGKDVSDWIEAGATAATIQAAINGASPMSGAVQAEATSANGGDGLATLRQIQTNDRPFRDVCADALEELRQANDPPTLYVRSNRGVHRSNRARPTRDRRAGRKQAPALFGPNCRLLFGHIERSAERAAATAGSGPGHFVPKFFRLGIPEAGNDR